MSNRFLSGVLVLLILGLGLLAITFAINWLAYTDENLDLEFSFERLSADSNFQDNNFAAAARYYGQLAQTDPYNGGARLFEALSLAQKREPFLGTIRRELRRFEPNPAVIEAAKLEVNNYSPDAIEAYERVLEFPEYRNFARFQLAKLHSYLGEAETAINYLSQAMDEKFKHHPIQRYLEFQPLLDDPEFQKLMERQ